jgi:FkbM family methyltransferase
MAILKILSFILKHPLNRGRQLNALLRFLQWQVGSRILNVPVVWPFVDEARLIIARGMTAATGNIYVGLMSFEEQAFILHYLQSSDVFFDIGANVGTFTILASKVCGAKTVAVEPDIENYRTLTDNVRLNNIEDRVTAVHAAVGSTRGSVKFTLGFGSISRVLKDDETETPCCDVPLIPLDEIAPGLDPDILKIDTEGYEYPVLAGGGKALSSRKLNVIMIELRGHGFRYGFDERAIDKQIRSLGFTACEYDPLARDITIKSSGDLGDMLYIRDISKARERVVSAKRYLINGRML